MRFPGRSVVKLARELGFIPSAIPRGRVVLTPEQVLSGVERLWSQDDRIIDAFEQAFADYIGVPHAVGVGSAKAGLAMLLRAMGAQPGQGVIVAGYNVPEVPAVLKALGMRVLAADIDPTNYNIAPTQVVRYAKQAEFLIITHLYGNPAPLNVLMDIAHAYGLKVLEDCAQALGAGFDGKRLGAHGNPCIFSFGMMKNPTALGGGMVTTPDPNIARGIRDQRAGGKALSGTEMARKLLSGVLLSAGTSPVVFPWLFPGLKVMERGASDLVYRALKSRPAQWEQGILDLDALDLGMHPAQAAIGLAGLGHVDRLTGARQRMVRALKTALQGNEGIGLPGEVPGARPAWTNFVVTVDNRQVVKKRMLDCGFDTTWGYLAAIDRIAHAGQCPNARRMEQKNLYLPVGATRNTGIIERMADCLVQAVRDGKA